MRGTGARNTVSDDSEPTPTPESERTLRDEPPSAEAVLGALERLPDDTDVLQTALHLATPVDEVVGIGIWVTDDGVRYRRSQAPLAEEPAEIARRAVRLATGGHGEGDRYLDLSGSADPVSWCKAVVSGEYLRLFGSRLLFGGPEVVAEPEIPPPVLFAALRRWLDDDTFRPPAVANLAGGTWLMEGSSTTLRLR